MLGVVIVAALAVRAQAGTVAVVVTGDPQLQVTLGEQLEAWLRTHGHTVGAPMATDVRSSLLNCMVIDDESCARGVVDARANTSSVVFGEVRAPRTKSSKATTLIVYLLVKGKAPVGMRRACEDCNADLMKSTLDEMLTAVIGASQLARGRLRLGSKPVSGLTVMLDNEAIGITPLEREVPAGSHTIVLMSRGRKVAERRLQIEPDVTAEIVMTGTLPPNESFEAPQRSRVVPGAALAVGGAAVVAGTILFFTSDVDDGTKFIYYDSRPVGIGIAVGGVALAALGAYLWVRAGATDSAPIAAVDQHGGIIGWARAF
ncbi:MAG TPA: PEGA domain-containing protein [Kofleriaceae bacterium]